MFVLQMYQDNEILPYYEFLTQFLSLDEDLKEEIGHQVRQ